MRKIKGIRCALVLLGVSVFFRASAQGKEDLLLYNFWQYQGDMSNILYTTLSKQAFRHLERRRDEISKLKTAEDWAGYQKSVKRKLKDILGDFPVKTPLNPVVTGVASRDGIRVEKLYFESLPNYYVTAALFIPENRDGRLPAILYCSGHAADGFRSETYQQVILNYVKKGFVVLAFDPIGQGERRQYTDSLPAFTSTQEHSYPGTQLFLSGRSPAYYFIWDGIRAIDYMMTRPEIDTARIGLTGRSGGGTQTTFIAAFDDRISAYAPEGYVTSFEKLLKSIGPPDAEQNLIGALYEGIDIADILAVSAPKPLMIISTTRDFFSIQGTRNAFDDLKGLYRAYGKEENLFMAEDDATHTSTKRNRESAYRFFGEYLDNPGPGSDEKVTFFPKEELEVTPGGNIFRTTKGDDLFSINRKYITEIISKRGQSLADSTSEENNLRKEIIEHTGYRDVPVSEPLVFSGRLFRNHYSVEKYLVKGVEDYHIPLLWFRPEKPAGKVVLLLDERGKNDAALNREIVDCLTKKGFEVIVPDLIGTGETGGGYNRGSAFIQNVPLNVWYLGVQTKVSPVSLRMGEIQILSNLIRSTLGTGQKFTVIGQGGVCTDLLHASLLDLGCEEILLINPLISYQSILSEKYYKTKYIFSSAAGAALKYDIPDIIEILAPMKIRIYQPMDARGNIADSMLIASTYKKVIHKYQLKGREQNFVIEPTANPHDFPLEAICNLLFPHPHFR